MTATDDQFVDPRPKDLDAERAVLGACIASADAVETAAQLLSPEDFYRPAHASLFETLLAEWETGHPIDPVSIAAALEQRNMLQRVGGAPFLHTLYASTPTAVSTGHWAEIVAEKAARARLLDASVRVGHIASEDTNSDTSDVLDRARQIIEEATASRVVSDDDGVWLSDVVDGHVSDWDRPREAGIRSPFADLTDVLGGLRPGQMCIAAGRPGSGKSTLATDWAVAAAKAGHSVMMASLEMSRGEVLDRMIAAWSKIRITDIQHRTMSAEERDRASRDAHELGKLPIRIEDRFVSTFAAVRAKARECRRSELGLDLLIVDHIGLLTGADPRQPRQEQVASFSRGFKLLAHEFQIPVLVVSQLNRGTEHRQEKVPVLSDLRESGTLEQDADVVILVHRPDYYERDSPRAGQADLILAKHRNGPTATITVAHQLHYGRFSDLARGPEPSDY